MRKNAIDKDVIDNAEKYFLRIFRKNHDIEIILETNRGNTCKYN